MTLLKPGILPTNKSTWSSRKMTSPGCASALELILDVTFSHVVLFAIHVCTLTVYPVPPP